MLSFCPISPSGPQRPRRPFCLPHLTLQSLCIFPVCTGFRCSHFRARCPALGSWKTSLFPSCRVGTERSGQAGMRCFSCSSTGCTPANSFEGLFVLPCCHSPDALCMAMWDFLESLCLLSATVSFGILNASLVTTGWSMAPGPFLNPGQGTDHLFSIGFLEQSLCFERIMYPHDRKSSTRYKCHLSVTCAKLLAIFLKSDCFIDN